MTNIARTLGTDALFSEWKINGEIDHFDEGWGMGAPIRVVSGVSPQNSSCLLRVQCWSRGNDNDKDCNPWEVGYNAAEMASKKHKISLHLDL